MINYVVRKFVFHKIRVFAFLLSEANGIINIIDEAFSLYSVIESKLTMLKCEIEWQILEE